MIYPAFAEKLIKGKIAESIFELMFRQAKQNVTHFGYEYTASLLLQDEFHSEENKAELDDLRHSPDFILTTPENHVHLVEVKFRSHYEPESILRMVKKTYERWHEAWYFIATPERFYFDSCRAIIQNNGIAPELPENIISRQIQSDYLVILNKFIPRHDNVN